MFCNIQHRKITFILGCEPSKPGRFGMKKLLISELLLALVMFSLYKLLMACGTDQCTSLCITLFISFAALFLSIVVTLDNEPGFIAAAIPTTGAIIGALDVVIIRWSLNWVTNADSGILMILGTFFLAVVCILITLTCIGLLVVTAVLGVCVAEETERVPGKIVALISQYGEFAILLFAILVL